MTEMAMALDMDAQVLSAEADTVVSMEKSHPDLLQIMVVEGLALDEPILLQPGERLALEGLSHTTCEHLAACLSGDLLPLAGRIHYQGQDLSESPLIWSKARSPEVLVIPPDGALLANFNAWENIWLVASYHRPNAVEQLMEEASNMLLSLGMDQHWTIHRPATLEPWQRLAVACARALVLRPRLLVLNSIFEGASSKELAFARALLLAFDRWSPQSALLYLGDKLAPAIQMKRLLLDI